MWLFWTISWFLTQSVNFLEYSRSPQHLDWNQTKKKHGCNSDNQYISTKYQWQKNKMNVDLIGIFAFLRPILHCNCCANRPWWLYIYLQSNINLSLWDAVNCPWCCCKKIQLGLSLLVEIVKHHAFLAI